MGDQSAEIGFVADDHEAFQFRVTGKLLKGVFRFHATGQPRNLCRDISLEFPGNKGGGLPGPHEGARQNQVGPDAVTGHEGADLRGLPLPLVGEPPGKIVCPMWLGLGVPQKQEKHG